MKCLSEGIQMSPHLPTELWLQILSFLPVQDVWSSTRLVNNELLICSESYLRDLLRTSSIGISLSLNTVGRNQRWYDQRRTVTFTGLRINDSDIVFGNCTVFPATCIARAHKSWRHLRIDDELRWRVELGEGSELRTVKLAGLVFGNGREEMSCGWRKLCSAYCSRGTVVQRSGIQVLPAAIDLLSV